MCALVSNRITVRLGTPRRRGRVPSFELVLVRLLEAFEGLLVLPGFAAEKLAVASVSSSVELDTPRFEGLGFHRVL